MGAAGARRVQPAMLDFAVRSGKVGEVRAATMNRALFIAVMLIAAPVAATESAFPNKPGKKPAPRLVVGAQSGAASIAPADVVVGAGAQSGQTGVGDYGFVAPTISGSQRQKRSVGYDPTMRLGNKRPNS